MSDKHQQRVLKYFVKNAPIGENTFVLDDLKKICGEDKLNQPAIRDALREYYESHRQQIKLDDGRRVMVFEMWRQEPIKNDEGEVVADFVYFDQKHGVKFSFDPYTLKAEVHGTDNDYPEQIEADWASYK